jgi:Rapsyn N-terminal myristoylation and linker region
VRIVARVRSRLEAAPRIVARIRSWLETAARIWAAYWLLIIGSFFFCSSLILRWVSFPISRSLNALQLPFSNILELTPRYHLFSYGVYALLVFAAGFAARRFSRFSLVFAATILITIFVALPCELAYEQPSVLHRLNAETTDVSLTRSFSRQYLPPNYGYLEEIPSHLELSTALGRLLAAESFLGLGWVCFGVGSLLITFYAFGRLPAGKRIVSTLCLILPLATVSVLLIRPLIGQHYFVQARIAQAHGYNELAIANYRKAIWWEKWFAEDINTYATIGDLQRQSNLAQGSPERRIKQAINFKQAGQFEPAIFELEQAANVGGELGLTARREAARVQVEFGLALYRAGAIGSAVVNWEQSLAKNPVQVQLLVFLATAKYDLARYEEALQTDHKAIDSVGLTSVLVNTYSLAGDCYTRLDDDVNARQYYSKSIKLDNDINLWAITGLAGN